MKKTQPQKTLALNLDTIRALQTDELRAIAGGKIGVTTNCPTTRMCTACSGLPGE